MRIFGRCAFRTVLLNSPQVAVDMSDSQTLHGFTSYACCTTGAPLSCDRIRCTCLDGWGAHVIIMVMRCRCMRRDSCDCLVPSQEHAMCLFLLRVHENGPMLFKPDTHSALPWQESACNSELASRRAISCWYAGWTMRRLRCVAGVRCMFPPLRTICMFPNDPLTVSRAYATGKLGALAGKHTNFQLAAAT